ncbi:aminodeoxychorismate/anthranilate synthase component II [Streptococcus pantholopis]|uniref:Glutamine amidotransferase n=1 Tax=Streptococcus pantholopis TaxID=1811193 RepID=A0A172Q8J2_9STRE|nr:aminodeoxychorismate/anthranilate synthase component II [Streptococcus pantholopis]AND79758.1 glutamine amidotransferase [Streptococcus pantholopis]
MILLIDNYDSFTYNLAQYIGTFSSVKVLRNDADDLYEEAQKASSLVFSPGPGWPCEAGETKNLIAHFAEQKPILGICLGHQAIIECFGGKLSLARQVMHGKQSLLEVDKKSAIFTDIAEPISVMRYHSIVADRIPAVFTVTAYSKDDQEVMAIQHNKLPVYGLQFHPESIGTPSGLKMIENFIKQTQDRMAPNMKQANE